MILKFRKIIENASLCVNFVRRCHTEQKPVRVRFAPSPTGFLHLGGLRTALYNYLYASSRGGKFILRIEDTDQTRLIPGATERIVEDLEWAGIQIDEGPLNGGRFGPYYQSKRLQTYRDLVKILLENGTAYYCFCSEKRLDLLRKEAIRARQVPKYDNKCRHLTPIQIAQQLAKNDTFCIRFKLSPYTKPFKDLICGNISHDVSENEGDPVIIKSDGFPTYHFANVIDDHLMKISHVFRGMEWQISTTKHLLLYRAFEWDPPEYGHLPLLVNPDGSKLSKRQSDIQLKDYRDRGIYPLALINYVTLSGGGFLRERNQNLKLQTLNELSKEFNISRINSNPGRLNPDLLNELNRLELLRRVQDKDECDKLVIDVQKMIQLKYAKQKENNSLDLNPEHIRNILKWAANRLYTLNDLITGNLSFLWILPPKQVIVDYDNECLKDLILRLRESVFERNTLQVLLKDFSKQHNWKYSSLMKTLRSALSGHTEGPGVAEMMEILGKDTTLNRVSNIKAKT